MFARLTAALKGNGVARPSARDELRASIARLRAADAVLSEKQTDTQRVEQLIATAHDDARSADAARAAAASVARQHALRGAKGVLSPTDQAVLDAAEAAERKARQSKLMASGATDALDEVRAAEAQAERDRDSAAEGVSAAVAQALIDQAETAVAELQQLQPRYQLLLRQIAALTLLLSPKFAPTHPYRTLVGSDSALASRMRELLIGEPRTDDLQTIVNDWLERARVVRREAEAN